MKLATLLVVIFVATVTARTVKVHRQDHVWSKEYPSGVRKQENVMPMAGGYLTLGAYFINITVGDPPQQFSVLVDTGSSNTAVPIAACKGCGTGPFYNPGKSSTVKPIACDSDACQKCVPEGMTGNDCVFGPPICAKETNNCGFGITYGGGSSALYGGYVYEKMCLGDLCGTAALGEIVDQYYFQTNFQSQNFYGIIGFAYPFNACNPTCTTPVFEDISKQNDVDNIVSMCITGTKGGTLDLGFIDDTKYTGELQWAPVILDHWYNIAMVDILVGSTSVGLRPFMFDTTNDVIGTFVDSGTSIIIVAPYTFNTIRSIFQTKYSNLPGISGSSGFFNASDPCMPASSVKGKLDQYPDVHFVVKGEKNTTITLTVSPEQYLMNYSDQMYCLGIAGTPSVGAVLGDVFMESYYVVFDRVNNRLGFAKATSNCT